ncbi:MAG: S8 family serine peptidase [Candidatus Hodarchaeota archaeon]
MKIKNTKKSEKLSLVFLLLILVPPFFVFIIPNSNANKIISQNKNIPIQALEISEQQNKLGIETAVQEDLYLGVDQNNNKLHDRFEAKLKSIKELKDSNEKVSLSSTQNIRATINDSIKIIIQFRENYDYSTDLLLFKNLGGKIKYTYTEAINGFSGSINYEAFLNFYNQLRDDKVPFFIEGDDVGNIHLFFTSRNTRLRPYVWKNYNTPYTGDNKSSIAILDSGIDEDHTFFDNDTTGKVIKFVDYVTGQNDTAYDDNGHGTHVAGIAAGLGTTADGLGRSVSTYALEHDKYLWAIDGLQEGVGAASFNVPSLGQIEIECLFNDSTQGSDYVIADFYLLDDDGYVVAQQGQSGSGNWTNNFTYTISVNSQLGDYQIVVFYTFKDGDGDFLCVLPDFKFRVELHWPFDPPDYGCGNLWKGVAPDAQLVGVKVINKDGGGFGSDAVKGVDWCINKRKIYNITVISMSLGYWPGFTALNDAVDNAVENGIVVVVSAGNDGPGGNYLESPGDADKVITVAANNFLDQITVYSSQGGVSNSTKTRKPDITAPGGSFNHLQIFSADTNDNDANGAYSVDAYKNELFGAQGTSMSCPIISGAANLLVQAMGGINAWSWDNASTSKMVKSLLLMTATETYPLKREGIPYYSPTLDRGGKDIHEGYGRMNVDAAIEAWILNWTTNITKSELLTASLDSSYNDPYAKHAKAGFVNLTQGQWYIFNLSVPAGADYDLHLYNSTPDVYGEPVLIVSSTSSIKGKDEILNYTAEYTGKYFLVIKAIGSSLPPISEEDDDEEGEKILSILEFLLSPLGLLIIGTVFAAVIIIVIIARRSARKRDERESERIKALMERSYY